MSTSSTFLRMTIVALAITFVALLVIVMASADPAVDLSTATKIYVG